MEETYEKKLEEIKLMFTSNKDENEKKLDFKAINVANTLQ